MPSITARCAVVVLAGGHSRRMTGHNKVLTVMAGKPLLEHVLTIMNKQSNTVLISSNTPLPFAVTNEHVVIGDHIGEGPLAGIAAGLRWLAQEQPETTWLVSVPCDCPFIPADLARQLIDEAEDDKTACCYATDSTGNHYIISAWSTTLSKPLESALAKGQYAAHRFLQTINSPSAHFELPSEAHIPSYFYNINTHGDVAQIDAQVAAHSE